MVSKQERWVSHIYLNLHIKGWPKESLSLPDALSSLVKQNVVGTLDVIDRDDRWIVQLVELQIEPDTSSAALLFLGIDKDRAAAIYGDINTLDLRSAAKSDDEGGAVSAHLLIDLQSDNGLKGHNAVLEDVQGLSRSRIIPYLRRLIGKFVPFSKENGDGDELNIIANLVDSIVPDKPISEQLNDARLLAVDVIKNTKNSNIDRRVAFFEKIRLIEYRPVSPVRGSFATNMIKDILAIAPVEDYPEMRIRIEESGGRERSVSVNRDKQDALLSAFQLRTLVKLDPPVEEATKRITKHLIAEMKNCLPERARVRHRIRTT